MNEEAKTHLNQCIEHTMARYSQGERGGAISCFLSGVGRHPGTNWIRGNYPAPGGSVMSMLFKAYDEGRVAFERALRSFADKEAESPTRTTIPVPRGSR